MVLISCESIIKALIYIHHRGVSAPLPSFSWLLRKIQAEMLPNESSPSSCLGEQPGYGYPTRRQAFLHSGCGVIELDTDDQHDPVVKFAGKKKKICFAQTVACAWDLQSALKLAQSSARPIRHVDQVISNRARVGWQSQHYADRRLIGLLIY